MGVVDQRIFGLRTAAPLLTKQNSQLLIETLQVWDSITPKAMYIVKQYSKHSNSCNKVGTLVHNAGGNNATEIY